jgi:hypothetical protein
MRRFPLIQLTLVVLALIASPLSSPSSALTSSSNSTIPVIASGRLLDGSGRPTAGNVELLAWPPAETQEVGQEVHLIPVAQTEVGPDGRFTLRAAETPQLAATPAATADRRGLAAALPR